MITKVLIRGIRKAHTLVPQHPELARDLYTFDEDENGMAFPGINFNSDDMIGLWKAPLTACELLENPTSSLRIWFESDPTCQLYHLLREAAASLIVKVAAIKCGLVNVKMCEDKTRGLMREMQGFELPPTEDIKAALPIFKRQSRPLVEWEAELSTFLGYHPPPKSAPPSRSPSYVTLKQADTINKVLEDALPGLKEEAKSAEKTAISRHESCLHTAVNQLNEDPFFGPHNLLSLAPSIRAEAVQDDLRACFCAANYHEQFLIMRAILEGEVVRYETMAYEYWDRVDDIKEKIKELEVLEGKKQRLRDVLMGARSEIPILEAKVTAFDQRSKSGHDRISSFHTPPPPATTSPLDHQPAGAEMARAQHRAEKMAAKGVSSSTTSGEGTGGPTTKEDSTNKPTTPTADKA